MVEKDLYGVENYIGKKYMIYYHDKWDSVVVEKQFKDKLKGDIFFIITSIVIISFGNILLFKSDVKQIFIIIAMVGCICLMGGIALISIWSILGFIHDIYKSIMTKKNGVLLEATVIQAEKTVHSKSCTTFYTICYEFEYHGNTIQKSYTFNKDSKIVILSEKDLIGKTYNIYYHPKVDRPVLCQYYKSDLSTGIFIVLICAVSLSLILACVLLDPKALLKGLQILSIIRID